MFDKIIKILIHPLFIYCIIATLECIPYESDLGKKVYHEMPKVGDNFQAKGDLGVYYYTGEGKYSYGTADCYFSLGNPYWGAKYEDGGIKTIEVAIANQIPLLGNMCEQKIEGPVKKGKASKNNFFSTNFLLDYFSGVSHFISYLILSLSLLYHLRLRKVKYWLTFVIVFIVGGILEFVQEFFIEGRHASYEDQISNSMGAVIAMLLFWILSKMKIFERIK